MKLPNGQYATLDISKLREYCLNRSHPRGRHKARVFASALSMSVDDSEELQHALLKAAKEDDAYLSAFNEYGTRYIIDLGLSRKGKSARVRSIWMVPADSSLPRFLTCYVLTS